MGPVVTQINIIAGDLDATLAFYRALGWQIDLTPDAVHAVAALPNGVRVEIDRSDFVPVWDSGYRGQTGGSTVLGLDLPNRGAVDDLYAGLVAAGHHGRQPPYDAFGGSRYAIVDDPNGNPVGLMSPSDDARRSWPPTPPPAGP
jgi:predicted enzyme related to lactoylglutathione lyase